MKRCKTCGIDKSLSEFHGDTRTADGRTSDCKVCACARARRCRAAKVEYWREHDRARSRTPERKAFEYHKVKRLRAKYPEKWKARYAVDNAVRKGLLRRMPCEVCGAQRTEAHHEDYTKPLDVKWLCHQHHREADRRMRERLSQEVFQF